MSTNAIQQAMDALPPLLRYLHIAGLKIEPIRSILRTLPIAEDLYQEHLRELEKEGLL